MLDIVYYRGRSRIKIEKGRRSLMDDSFATYAEECVRRNMFFQEIANIDRRIDEINDQYARIKEDLESLYCTLRCEQESYRSESNEELIALSHRADVCIEEVYTLRNRRKRLVDLLDQGN